MQPRAVFFDPTGKRRKTFSALLALLSVVAGALVSAFVFSLVVVPLLPHEKVKDSRSHVASLSGIAKGQNRKQAQANILLDQERSALQAEIERVRKEVHELEPPTPSPAVPGAEAPGAEAPGAPIVIGFYAPWQETGLHSLRAHAAQLTHVMPEWFHLAADGDDLDTRDFDPAITPLNSDVMAVARANHLEIQPILNNAADGNFDPKRVDALLRSPEKQSALIRRIVEVLTVNQFSGLNLDFENLSPEAYAELPKFLLLLGKALHQHGLRLSIDLEADRTLAELHAFAEPCDFVIAMAYDEHFAEGKAGPIASVEFFAKTTKRFREAIPVEKLVMGLGSYGYDWTVGKAGAEELTYQGALVRAADEMEDIPPEDGVQFDEESLNPYFDYDDDQGVAHQVWFLDAAAVYNQWRIASRSRVTGAALWLLGSEDPGVWEFLGRDRLDRIPKVESFERIKFPYEIEFQGVGEILTVRATPMEGKRDIHLDPMSGLITEEKYSAYPSSYIIERSGYAPKHLALTFDDGPDEEFTAQILDVLREYQVHATFFMIGMNAERMPSMVRRIYDEGHDVGSHSFTHPNLAAVSRRRRELEMNATQRAFQTILGRSTTLFRPPYNADAEPTSAEEVVPIVDAAKLNYRTVGELIDPQDWNLVDANENGETRERSAQEITQELLKQVRTVDGNIILLHDGGGDRSATVAALRAAIPQLLGEGYSFVTVSELLHESRDQTMPPVAAHDVQLVGVDRVAFELFFGAEQLLRIAFLLGIGLGIGRILLVVPLAILSRLRNRRSIPASFMTDVSVLIAAYNEEAVIVRTVQSALASVYPVSRVIVVDDGSKDHTANRVREVFGDEPRVQLIVQENSGKSAALNAALRACESEVVVCVDADTQIDRDAIAPLVARLADPRVAAVAGNIKVGNRLNLLTEWQSIEYITCQNMDREAYALLNAVTVVPGALGAWRRAVILEAGGYSSDTLAEDTELTWRIRELGYRLESEPTALGYTEAPMSLAGLFKQRYRWSYGTLQCLWKHRHALGRHGFFGALALPTLWLFQVFFQILAPIIDLQLLVSFCSFVVSWTRSSAYTHDWQPQVEAFDGLERIAFYYGLFFTVELLAAAIAFLLDRERPRPLLYLFFQRFVYRQLMYAVMWRALQSALWGFGQGWSKLQRTGTVQHTGTVQQTGTVQHAAAQDQSKRPEEHTLLH